MCLHTQQPRVHRMERVAKHLWVAAAGFWEGLVFSANQRAHRWRNNFFPIIFFRGRGFKKGESLGWGVGRFSSISRRQIVGWRSLSSEKNAGEDLDIES